MTDDTEPASVDADQIESERLRQIIDAIAVYVCILDPQGRVIQLDARTGQTAGLSPRSFLGHRIDALPFDCSERSRANARVALAQAQRGEHACFDLEVVDRPGEVSVIETSLRPILACDGRVREIVAAGLDVTQRRADEQRLRESLSQREFNEARLADAQRIAEVGDWDWDIATDTVCWSAQIHRIFAREPHDAPVTYDEFLSMVHEDDRAAVIAAVDHTLETGEKFHIEHRIVRPAGEIRYLSDHGELTRDGQGQPIRLRGTAQDITRQKAVEAQLRASLSEKDALLHELHHRVKNNLQVVASLLYLQAVDASDDLRAILDECRGRIRSMTLIHEQLYLSGELSHIDMCGVLTQLSEEIVRLYASNYVHDVDIQVLGSGLVLEVERAIPVALIANEILTNALKYAYPDGGGPGKAGIRVWVGPDSLAIEDDGVGLPADFESASTSLGLRLVRTLARQLDAEIEFSTPAGGGTAIRLYL